MRDGDDGDVEVLGEDGRAFFELLGRAFDGALAFGIEDEDFSGAQSVGSGTHGGDEVGVGIERNEVQELGELAHDSGAEDFGGADVEDVVERLPRQRRDEVGAVEIAGVIGAEDVGRGGEVFHAVDAQAEERARDELAGLDEEPPEESEDGAAAGDGEHVGVGHLGVEDGAPSLGLVGLLPVALGFDSPNRRVRGRCRPRWRRSHRRRRRGGGRAR